MDDYPDGALVIAPHGSVPGEADVSQAVLLNPPPATK
jgi:hypothetical protein